MPYVASRSLYDELLDHPGGPAPEQDNRAEVAIPLRITHEGRELRFLSTEATFGTPVDITPAEVTIRASTSAWLD